MGAALAVEPRISDLSDHLGFWLRAVSNHVSQAFAEKLASEGVAVPEWVMMRLLYGVDPTPPSRLAERMGMTRGGVTKLADRLIGRSLIVRRASPDDGRCADALAGHAARPKAGPPPCRARRPQRRGVFRPAVGVGPPCAGAFAQATCGAVRHAGHAHRIIFQPGAIS